MNLFDPGVLVDKDGRVYMYMGYAPLPGWMKTAMELRGFKIDAGYCVELEQDMITMKSEPVQVIPGPSLTKFRVRRYAGEHRGYRLSGKPLSA